MTQSFSQIDTCVLTSHAGEIIRQLFVGISDIAIRETQLTFWIYFYFCLFVLLSYCNIDIEIFKGRVASLFVAASSSSSCVTFCYFLVSPLPSIPGDLLFGWPADSFQSRLSNEMFFIQLVKYTYFTCWMKNISLLKSSTVFLFTV